MRDPDAEITGGEAAKLLQVTRQQISKLARSGKLPGRQVLGRYWVFKRRDVQAYKRAEKAKGGRPKKAVPQAARRGSSDLAEGEDT